MLLLFLKRCQFIDCRSAHTAPGERDAKRIYACIGGREHNRRQLVQVKGIREIEDSEIFGKRKKQIHIAS